MRVFSVGTLLIMLALLLAACGGDDGSSSDTTVDMPTDEAADAVEQYYEAMVNKEEEDFFSVVCADWEGQASIDFDSFSTVDASIEDLTCADSGEEGDMTLVTCSGRITVVYDGESGELMNLADSTFYAVQENDEWRMCGYQ